MPLYKSSQSLRKSKFKPPLLSNKLNCEKLVTSSPVEVTDNNFFNPIEEEKLTPQNQTIKSTFDSPSAADDSDKIAQYPKESASSFEIKKAVSKEAKQDQKIFGERLEEKSPKKRNKEKRAQVNVKNKSDKKKLNEVVEVQEKVSKKLKELEKSKKPGKKDRKEKIPKNSQSSELSVSQQYLLLEEINEPAPPENASQRERLEWLQNERNVGLYVQCDNCDKFRYLKDVMDPTDLPEKWYCNMNKDQAFNSCDVPEVKVSAREEEDLIFNEYNAGSIVWAKLPSYPWWPAMVDDDPDVERYYWLKDYSAFPTHYNVTFFDSELVSRAWITPNFLKAFRGNENMFRLKNTRLEKRFFERFNVAKRQAIEALSYGILDRLKKFSFLARWPYEIASHPDDNEKRQKRNKKRKTSINKKSKTYDAEKTKKVTFKNDKKNTDENKKVTFCTENDKKNADENKKITFCTGDDQNNEANWDTVMSEENMNGVIDNTIAICYSPDLSFDVDFF